MTEQGGFDTFLLGRLGTELAQVYHDTLQAPLPAGLKVLIDRLERQTLAQPSRSDHAGRPDLG